MILEPATFADAYRMVRYVEDNRANVKALFIDARIFPAVAETLTSMGSGPGAHLKLILTDVQFDNECIRRWIDKGVYACVRKPFSADEIAAFLR